MTADTAAARRAILVAVGAMLAGCLWVPVVALLAEPDPVRRWLGVAGVLALTAAGAAALHAVATPSTPARRQRLLFWAFGLAAALSIPLVAPVGPDSHYTWAWIGGGVAGFAPLLLRGLLRWLAPVAVVLLAVAVGAVAGGSPVVHGVIAASLAATLIATIVLPFWLWNLLLQARAGRAAQAQLAVAEERLRFARDVHDLLGHRLTVIALKTELAARLSAVDPARAGQEAAEAQALAATALAEVREAVRGYRSVDFGDQLRAVSTVLQDAGIRCEVTGSVPVLAAEPATQLALVLREACTNVVRHSTAGWCTIDVSQHAEGTRMTIANDGATLGDGTGSGLRGAAERLASVGGTLRTRMDGDVFTLDVTVPAS